MKLSSHLKILSIRSQLADPSPPLGTILGNIGVNTVSFCNSFNTYTKNLPNYFTLRVIINISVNRTFTFKTEFPSMGSILNLLKFERVIKVWNHDRWNDKVIICIKLYDLIQIVALKFNDITFNRLKVIKGFIKSMNLIVVR